MNRGPRLVIAVIAAAVLGAGALFLVNRLPPSAAATGPPASEPATTPSADSEFQIESSLFQADWLDTEEAQCPTGTSLRGAPPPEGNEVWCARPGGTRHGQHIHWQSNGRKAFERRYNDGTLDGYWAEWQISGKPWTVGQYQQGARHGRWMRWQSDRRIRVRHYENGVLLKEQILDETGLELAE